MTVEIWDMILIVALLCASVVCLLIPPMVWVDRWYRAKKLEEDHKKTGGSNMLLISLCLVGAVWCLRYAVGYYTVCMAGPAAGGLNWFEELLNSITHTVKTFSTDEEYATRVLEGRAMLVDLFPKVTWLPGAFGVYASVLNVMAPVFGGAVVFEILASIFPKLRLFLVNGNPLREKYFFSEINYNSLALAQSICAENTSWLRRPAIVFTDSYIKNEEEKSVEMLLEAKAMGAICVRDDLSHVRKNRWGGRKFFLIDTVDKNNLQALVQLSYPRNCGYLEKTEIYLFVEDDAYVSVEASFRKNLIDVRHIPEDQLPYIYPIKSYRNMITNMLVDIPLFEPLINKPKKDGKTWDLTVTVLGIGHIGMEMIKSTYSFGQILDCELTINVLSWETEQQFWSKLDYINPEIRRSMDPKDPILRMNRRGDLAPPYCTLRYTQCDVKSSAFIQSLTDPENNILETDYFLVALGADEDNISVANTIKTYVGQHHIKIKQPRNQVINYVVYDSDLARSLNSTRRYYFINDTVDVLMTAVGSLSEVFSSSNIFMTEHKERARQIYDSYLAVCSREEAEQNRKERATKDDYKYWADLARAMHIKYKIFSMGMFHVSQMNYSSTTNEAYLKALEEIYKAYKDVALAKGELDFDTEQERQAHQALRHRMAWVEHRRWNAFLRAMGYRHSDDYSVYSGRTGNYKHMQLRLHPCLVECDQKGMRGFVKKNGTIDEEVYGEGTSCDLLDNVTYDTNRLGLTNYDFKESDYPEGDFSK